MKRALKGTYPIFHLKVRTLGAEEEVILKNLENFDEAFENLQVDRRSLLNSKLYLSSKVLESIRKKITHKQDQFLVQKYLSLVAHYQSELLLLDY